MEAKNLLPWAMLCVLLAGQLQAKGQTASLSMSTTEGQVRSSYGNLPLMFEANQGQSDSQVRFVSHGGGYSMFLTAGGLVLAVSAPNAPASSKVVAESSAHQARPTLGPIHQMQRSYRNQESSSLAIHLVGSAPNPQIVGEIPLQTRVNYFVGRDPSQWHRNIPTYGQVRYHNVYPGIDLVYYGNNRHLEYDFDLAPGADPENIEFSVTGTDALTIDSLGNLVLTKNAAQLVFHAPVVYQMERGARIPVAGSYVLRDSSHAAFSVGNYDRSKPLTIDPVLVYSTFVGGSGDVFSNGIEVDSSGDAYMVGTTDSPSLPSGSHALFATQFRMFLIELDPTGSTLLFANYFGGTSGGDEPYAVVLDGSGNPYITGDTPSSDFPVVNAYQSTLSGTEDAFLIKFSSDGSTIDYSTYLGGSTSQLGTSIAVDPSGEAMVAGMTQSTDFPVVNASQSSVVADQFGDWGVYGFLAKFAADGSSPVYSTYLAGSSLNTASWCSGCLPDSEVWGVASDASGNAYVTGVTNTADFPVTAGAFAIASPGTGTNDVGFVSKFSNTGALAYSTYLGGQTSSRLDAIAVDATGSAYVTGYDTANDGFPIVTTSICDPSVSACNGAVIAKLDPTGATLVYSTFLGTSNNMNGQAIQVDSSGDAFIAGSDVQFDLYNPIEEYAGNRDVVIAEIDSSASTVLMATFLGGQQLDEAAGLALDSSGAVYVTGVTQSFDFPVTQSAFQTVWGGPTDSFIAKIDPVTAAPAVAMAPFALQFSSESMGTTSPSQTSLLRNMGSQSLSIASKSISGDFAETDDCGTTVAPASSCTFTITFTPTGVGTRTGTLTIVDDAQGSPHSVSLTGSGAPGPPSIAISPSSLSFSSTAVGTISGVQTITIANTGTAPVQISNVQATSQFSAASTTCSSLTPGNTCAVQVTFTPNATGESTGSLSLTDSTSGTVYEVPLSGAGVDFTFSAPSSSTTVSAGGNATYVLNFSSVGGSFPNSISLKCTGAPAFSTCTLSPSSITPGNSSPVTVTVTTSGTASGLAGGWLSRKALLASLLATPLSFFSVFVVGGRRRVLSSGAIVATFLFLGLMMGCAGTSTGASGSYGVTPPGTYNLSVIATCGNLQHVTNLTLVVQ